MRSITLHEVFARVYWNETPPMVCWMVYSLHYMSFFTLHGFFECIYRNETPLLTNLWLPLHEFLYTTWSSLHVYTGMKRLWRSVGWSIAYTTWVSLHYMAFLNAYTGMKRLCWHISDFHYMSSFTLHEVRCMCILEWNASDDWSLVYTTWDPLHYMSFWSICWQKRLLAGL